MPASSPRPHRPILAALLFGLALAAPAVTATGGAGTPLPVPQPVLDSPAFLDHHPDIRHQLNGLFQLRQGRHPAALESFQRGARYADKLSQAMVARMYWQGLAGRTDRATAYAWMDLAAERGYVPLLAEREAMWAALDAQEQARAIEVGRGLYDEYGDAVAKPRMEQALRAGLRRSVTGSRTGWTAGVSQLQPNADGFLDLKRGGAGRIDLLDPRWWDPARYWQLQDERWAQAGIAARD